MDAKLNHSDLSTLFAKSTGVSGAKAEAFTKAFFDIIIEGLEKDGSAKINGLGTFKITDVASRGSVDVNTGEKIEIKGHKKLTFLPADTLKDKVNQPFAMFEPVEVDDTCVGEECNDEEATAEELITEEPATEESSAVLDKPADVATAEVADEPVIEKNAETSAEEPATDTELVAEEKLPTEEPSVAEEQKADDADKTIEPAQKGKRWIYTLIPIIIICAGAFLLYMYSKQRGETAVADAEKVVTVAELDANSAMPDTTALADSTTVAVAEIEEPYEFKMLEELANKPTRSITMSDTLLYVAKGEITTHTVATDETLARIAFTYYGDRKLWPYIVQYNKLRNPNELAKGMQLAIPCLYPR